MKVRHPSGVAVGQQPSRLRSPARLGRRGSAFRRSRLALAAFAATVMVQHAQGEKQQWRGMWPWGRPIASIRVVGFGRRAELTDPHSLAYIARDIRAAPQNFHFDNGPPWTESRGDYEAIIHFAGGPTIQREVYARRFPRAICFDYQPPPWSPAPLVPLYSPMPRDLRRFWHFLVTPGDRGTRRFGPRVGPEPSPRPPRPFNAGWWRGTAPPSFILGLPGSAFTWARPVGSVRLADPASIAYIQGSAGFLPSKCALPVNTRWHHLAFDAARKKLSYSLPAGVCRFPRMLVIAWGNSHRFVCPLYGPLPSPLHSLYEKLLAKKGGRTSEPMGAGCPKGFDPHRLGGTYRNIVRIGFVSRGSRTVMLSDPASLAYLQAVQRYFPWGYDRRNSARIWAAVMMLTDAKGKLPQLQWVVAQRYPRELIFTVDRGGYRADFTEGPQIRCPLYSPLPPPLYRVYHRLLQSGGRKAASTRSTRGAGNGRFSRASHNQYMCHQLSH